MFCYGCGLSLGLGGLVSRLAGFGLCVGDGFVLAVVDCAAELVCL